MTQGFVSPSIAPASCCRLSCTWLLLRRSAHSSSFFPAEAAGQLQLAIEAAVVLDIRHRRRQRRPEPAPPRSPSRASSRNGSSARPTAAKTGTGNASAAKNNSVKRPPSGEKQAASAAAVKFDLKRRRPRPQAKKEAEANGPPPNSRAERKAAEERARQEQEEAAQAEGDAERRERQRPRGRAIGAMAAEEEFWRSSQSGGLAYLALIQQKVERNWMPAAPAPAPGLNVRLRVRRFPVARWSMSPIGQLQWRRSGAAARLKMRCGALRRFRCHRTGRCSNETWICF